MKVVFISNYLNHHQVPFCERMRELCEEFVFVATDIQNIQGYQSIVDAEYVIKYDELHSAQVKHIVSSFDVAIFGSCPHDLIHERMQYNKLSFHYSERFYRKGLWRSISPRTRKKLMERVGKYRNDNMYVLCASAFLPIDLRMLRFPSKKCYKWGYFPKIEKIEWKTLENLKNSTMKIIWVARMLDWKHPEMAINTALYLKDRGVPFELNMIGDGPVFTKIKKEVEEKDLGGYVHLLGSVAHEKVYEYMKESSVFLFTSDKTEGWGAVLNEAMGCGCAPVCSHLIGSVPFLVEHNVNGIIFKEGDQEDLNIKVEHLANDRQRCQEFGYNSYIKLHEKWNAEVASERLVELSKSLLENKDCSFEDGPCSNAMVLRENWINGIKSFS